LAKLEATQRLLRPGTRVRISNSSSLGAFMLIAACRIGWYIRTTTPTVCPQYADASEGVEEKPLWRIIGWKAISMR
jgi:hypothetical protein